MIAELESKKKILDNKVKKLKIKRDNQDMTNELCQMRAVVFKYSRGEKYDVVEVIISWIIFSIVVMVRNL